MPNAEDNLSPEEKLLRVIQGGDDLGASEAQSGDDGVSDAEETLPALEDMTVPVTSAPPPAEAKPKLKLADRQESTPASESPPGVGAAVVDDRTEHTMPASELADPETIVFGTDTEEIPFPFDSPTPPPDAGIAVPDGDGAGKEEVGKAAAQLVDVSAAPRKKGMSERTGAIVILNRCLSVAILAVLVLTGVEVFNRASVAAVSVPEAPPRMEKRVEQLDVPGRESLIDKYVGRDIFRIPSPGETEPPIEQNLGKIYVQRHVKLIGTSPLGDGKLEAIVVDMSNTEAGSKGRMLFLEEGESLPLSDESLKGITVVLSSVSSDAVVFSVDGEEVTIEAGK